MKRLFNKIKVLDGYMYIENNEYVISDKKPIHWDTKFETEVEMKIYRNISARITHVLKKQNAKKCLTTTGLLNCSLDYFMDYLESKFTIGMSWDNYGRDGWHIDHIKPCSSFDLRLKKHQKQCFCFNNMQPLWAVENMAKNSKINWDANDLYSLETIEEKLEKELESIKKSMSKMQKYYSNMIDERNDTIFNLEQDIKKLRKIEKRYKELENGK